MSKLDISAIPFVTGSSYPEDLAKAVEGRWHRKLGEAGGLTDFGVNIVQLQPGAWSSQRHWHSAEDEFVMVLGGELVMVTDAGETLMKPGDCAAFPKGKDNAHHFINRSESTAAFLVVGTDTKTDVCIYPDVPMVGRYDEAGNWKYDR